MLRQCVATAFTFSSINLPQLVSLPPEVLPQNQVVLLLWHHNRVHCMNLNVAAICTSAATPQPPRPMCSQLQPLKDDLKFQSKSCILTLCQKFWLSFATRFTNKMEAGCNDIDLLRCRTLAMLEEELASGKDSPQKRPEVWRGQEAEQVVSDGALEWL